MPMLISRATSRETTSAEAAVQATRSRMNPKEAPRHEELDGEITNEEDNNDELNDLLADSKDNKPKKPKTCCFVACRLKKEQTVMMLRYLIPIPSNPDPKEMQMHITNYPNLSHQTVSFHVSLAHIVQVNDNSSSSSVTMLPRKMANMQERQVGFLDLLGSVRVMDCLSCCAGLLDLATCTEVCIRARTNLLPHTSILLEATAGAAGGGGEEEIGGRISISLLRKFQNLRILRVGLTQKHWDLSEVVLACPHLACLDAWPMKGDVTVFASFSRVLSCHNFNDELRKISFLLSGNISVCVENPNLTELRLRGKQESGTVPSTLLSRTSVQGVRSSESPKVTPHRLSTTIPTGDISVFATNPNLSHLILESTQVQGVSAWTSPKMTEQSRPQHLSMNVSDRRHQCFRQQPPPHQAGTLEHANSW